VDDVANGVKLSLDIGGAVAIVLAAGSNSTFVITDNVTLADNTATRRGGAFYISALLVLGKLSGINILRSSAAAGSGFYWHRQGVVAINDMKHIVYRCSPRYAPHSVPILAASFTT